jgi:hypothetical protein
VPKLKKEHMKDKKFLVLSSVFFLLFIGGIVAVTLDRPTSQILRAQNATFSPLKSFIIIYPITATVGSKVKVSVYARDINSELIPNRGIKLSVPTRNISVTPSDTQNTGAEEGTNFGMAQFFISTKTPGKYQINARDLTSNTAIINSPSVEFTQ